MSQGEIVRIASRILTVFFIGWAFADITYLPDHFLALFHYANQRSVLIGETYLVKYYSASTFSIIVRMLVFLSPQYGFGGAGNKSRHFFRQAE